MSLNLAGTSECCRNEPLMYERLPLVQLTARIVDSRDHAALAEFHEHRNVFHAQGIQPMVLSNYLESLCHSSWALDLVGYGPALLDFAYDLTLDKFSHLPKNGPPQAKRSKNGPDCRFYFGSFLDWMKQWRRKNPSRSVLEEEAVAARVLQSRVLKHFRFSCLEAKRKRNPSRSRYAWQVNGISVLLMMPTPMSGEQRRSWLETNVNDPDPSRPGERDRIQALVDEHLSFPRRVRIDCLETGFEVPVRIIASPPGLIEEEVGVKGLAKVVADEKVENLHQQRPSIQKLGGPALKKLILAIFEDLARECYQEKRLAEEYGLDRSSFTRFAGSRWRVSVNGRPPDLWANVAETLAGHEAFMEVARQTGVWADVEVTLEKRPRRRRKSDA